MKNLMVKPTNEIRLLGCPIPDLTRRGEHCLPDLIAERGRGEREAVLTWLRARTEALSGEGYRIYRTRFRQRDRYWAAKIVREGSLQAAAPIGSPELPRAR